jgi:Cellulose biosynthesis protein BcsS
VYRCVSVLVIFGLSLSALGGAAGMSRAEEAPAAAGPAPAVSPWREVAVGAIAMPHSWVAYSSATIAPFGALDLDGLRLRLGSGYGKYTYETLPPTHDDCRYGKGDGKNSAIHGRVSFVDILAGYQVSYGRLTAKGFAGWAMDEQSLSPRDICNASSGRESGFKAVVETWTNITPKIWLSLDGSWAQAHRAYSAQARLGYRLMPELSIGIEGTALGNVAGEQLRPGLFARYHWAWGEATLSGGVGGERFSLQSPSKDDAWGSLNVMIRY